MNVDVVGEDPVTRSVLVRLITTFRPDISIGRMMPVRGGEIIRLAPILNRSRQPVVLLTDLDNKHCAPTLIGDWLDNDPLLGSMLFRVACDEVETWLMADREGIARWMDTDVDLIPVATPVSARDRERELRFKYKPSLFLMMVLANNSRKQQLRAYLMPQKGASKGPNYNAALIPFIEHEWDIENACRNSDSLRRAISRLETFTGLP